MELYVYEPGAEALRRLTDARGYDAEASYSPNGKWIVFTSMRSGYAGEAEKKNQKQLGIDPSWFAEIYVMRADGSKLKRLTHTPGYDGGPFFSPDGKRIVWRRFDEEGLRADVWTMKVDGSDQRQLTDFGCMSWAPFFHPSGEYVIFTSNKLGFSNFELFIVDALGLKEPVRVTHTEGFDGLPVPTPDGKGIAWTSTRRSQGKGQIFMAGWNHEKALEALRLAPAREPSQAGGAAQADPAATLASDMQRLGFQALPGQEGLEVPFEIEGRQGRNIIGLLPPSQGAAVAEGAILLGAYLDDAVGLEAAKKIASATRRQSVIVAIWADEEGARAWSAPAGLQAGVYLGRLGTLADNRIEILGAWSSPVWRGLVERANVPVGFDIQVVAGPEAVSGDVTVATESVPAIVLRAVATDVTKSPDPEEVERVARFSALLLRRLDGLENPPEYVDVASLPVKPKLKKQSPYTGTIPDYTAEVEGLRMSGVMEDGPAEKAGIAEGDVIVEFAGKQISGIYDYRDALDIVEVGRPIQVIFVRDGERHEVTLVPTVRP